MPPTVGAHMGGTWNSSPRSQLQGGYMNANSAAKERTPKSHVHKHKAVCAPAPWLVFRIYQPFPASAPKSVISETENGTKPGSSAKGWTDVLRMAQTQKLSCLPKQPPLTDGTWEMESTSEYGRQLPTPVPQPRPEEGNPLSPSKWKNTEQFPSPFRLYLLQTDSYIHLMHENAILILFLFFLSNHPPKWLKATPAGGREATYFGPENRIWSQTSPTTYMAARRSF